MYTSLKYSPLIVSKPPVNSPKQASSTPSIFLIYSSVPSLSAGKELTMTSDNKPSITSLAAFVRVTGKEFNKTNTIKPAVINLATIDIEDDNIPFLV